MARLDPWDELRIMARNALNGNASARGVALQAGRCRYYTIDGAAQAHAAAMNALKTLCLAWGDAPAPALASVRAGVAASLDALDAWPREQRAEKPASKFAQPRRAPAAGPKPYWMERD